LGAVGAACVVPGSLPRRDLCDDALDSDAFAEAAEKLVVPRTDHGRFVALDGSLSDTWKPEVWLSTAELT